MMGAGPGRQPVQPLLGRKGAWLAAPLPSSQLPRCPGGEAAGSEQPTAPWAPNGRPQPPRVAPNLQLSGTKLQLSSCQGHPPRPTVRRRRSAARAGPLVEQQDPELRRPSLRLRRRDTQQSVEFFNKCSSTACLLHGGGSCLCGRGGTAPTSHALQLRRHSVKVSKVGASWSGLDRARRPADRAPWLFLGRTFLMFAPLTRREHLPAPECDAATKGLCAHSGQFDRLEKPAGHERGRDSPRRQHLEDRGATFFPVVLHHGVGRKPSGGFSLDLDRPVLPPDPRNCGRRRARGL